MKSSVRAIIPDKFDQDAMMKVLAREMEKYAPFMVNDFERVVRPWDGEKPTFSPAFYVHLPNDMRLTIRVIGPEMGRNKWKWLNEGTQRHKIVAKNAPRLAFRGGYQAGSKPNSKFTHKASAGKGPLQTPKEVMHPGNKPRNFTHLIILEHEKPFAEWMKAAMRRAAAASGHQYQK